MRAGSGGSTLIVVLLLSSVVAAAGLSLAIVAQQERALSVFHARELRLRRAALDAVRFPSAWFADPGAGPAPDQVVRLRLPADPEHPAGPPLSPLGEYKEGVDLDEDGRDDLFQSPFGGSDANRFIGHRDHPDVMVREEAFLMQVTRELFGFDEATAVERRRVESIKLFAPPVRQLDGESVRDGIATVMASVVLERRRADGGYRIVGRREARGVLREIPYRLLAGPMLDSCSSLTSHGGWSPRWGRVRVGGNLTVAEMPGSIPASLPVDSEGDLWSEDTAWIDAFNAAVDPGEAIPDPWSRLSATGVVSGAPSTDSQPWPHLPPPEGTPAPWSCCGHSHIRQLADQPGCSTVDYESWKSLAQSGLRGVVYHEWAEADRYRDDDGIARSMQQILEARAGEAMFRFFDTADGRPPADLDGDGAIDNLTPAVTLSGDIGLRGLMIAHAQRLTLRDLDDGIPVSLRAPREPANAGASAWVDLQLLPDGGFYPGGPPERSGIEPVATILAAMEGGLLQAGDLTRLGGGTLVGRIRARSIALDAESTGARIFPLPELEGRGVVDGWHLPRFVITEIGIDGG